jgi:hypothetical protein
MRCQAKRRPGLNKVVIEIVAVADGKLSLSGQRFFAHKNIMADEII